jgi:hypothetical protein
MGLVRLVFGAVRQTLRFRLALLAHPMPTAAESIADKALTQPASRIRF